MLVLYVEVKIDGLTPSVVSPRSLPFSTSYLEQLLCYFVFTCSENRYVLFLTENYAALDILKNPKSYLEEGLSISQSENEVADVQPFILFGSSFPKDKEYTQVHESYFCLLTEVLRLGAGGPSRKINARTHVCL